MGCQQPEAMAAQVERASDAESQEDTAEEGDDGQGNRVVCSQKRGNYRQHQWVHANGPDIAEGIDRTDRARHAHMVLPERPETVVGAGVTDSPTRHDDVEPGGPNRL